MIDRNTDNPPHGVFHAEGCEYSATLYRELYHMDIVTCERQEPMHTHRLLSCISAPYSI